LLQQLSAGYSNTIVNKLHPIVNYFISPREAISEKGAHSRPFMPQYGRYVRASVASFIAGMGYNGYSSAGANILPAG
jgi:hypothetical protein